MKFLSILLLLCITGLSLFPAAVVTPLRAEANCCIRGTGKSLCYAVHKKKPNKNCGDPACQMMLTCNICGFLVVDRLSVQPAYVQYNGQTVTNYKIGDLSAYHAADWKPPRFV